MRIIAGTQKGRSLKVPRNTEVRPTADRVKETVFNVLGQWFEGERVLDLYAGVGGLGIEALSRGAGHTIFVEKDRTTMGALTENLDAAGFSGISTTYLSTIERAIKKLMAAKATFHLVFADPPYALRETPGLVRAIDEAGLVAEGGRLIVEHDRREEVPESAGLLAKVDERRFGDTMVTFYARRTRLAEPSAS